MKIWVIRFLIALLFLAGAAFTLNSVFNRPPVPLAKLDAIKQGAPWEEVQSILGKPTHIYEANRKWAYSKPFGWSIVYVYFDEQGRFERYEYDY